MRLKWKLVNRHPLILVSGVYSRPSLCACVYVKVSFSKGYEIYCLIFIWYTWKVHYINAIQTLYDRVNASKECVIVCLFVSSLLSSIDTPRAEETEKRKWMIWFDLLFLLYLVSYGNQIVIECTKVFSVIKFAFFQSSLFLDSWLGSVFFIEKACFFGFRWMIQKSAFESNRWVLLLSFKSIFFLG